MAQSVVMGVDVGGTKIATGLVDENGEVLHTYVFPTDRNNQETVLASIHNAIGQAIRQYPAGIFPQAMGIGLVGWIDPLSGTWLQSMNLHVDTPLPLAGQLSSHYGLPVMIDNDVHAATLAELRWGIGRQCADFVYLNAGTGIAAGLVCNGKLVRGAVNYAGEMGHIFVDPAGDPCVCGQVGCLEPLASGGGILERVRRLLPQHPGSALNDLEQTGQLSVTAVFTAAKRHDPLAALVTDQAVRALGAALTDVVNLLNPEYVILGGGIFSAGPFAERLQQYVSQHALTVAYRSLKGILPSQLQVDRVGLLGAASLAWR
jgi:glucokinase